MDALEREAREKEPLPPELQRVIDRRNRTILPDSYSSQGRLYDLTYYSDDGHAMVVGASRAVRFLRAFWTIAGSDGLNAPLSRAGKQQIGACVVWLGGTLAAGLGLVWIPKEKVSRAALGLSTVLGGRIPLLPGLLDAGGQVHRPTDPGGAALVLHRSPQRVQANQR